MPRKFYVGIDGCKIGWFYTVLDQKTDIVTGIAPDINWLWINFNNAALMLIDIPIGLTAKYFRTCDVDARQFLGPGQASRVFPPPCREAVYAESYAQACTINQRHTGKKISRQTWNITAKIREVDMFMRANPKARGKIRESHPEICFRAFCGSPLKFSKKRSAGIKERLDILSIHLPMARRLFENTLMQTLRKDAARDDILDSMVTAVTARFAAKRTKTLPKNPERDAEGLEMEMVYALAETPPMGVRGLPKPRS